MRKVTAEQRRTISIIKREMARQGLNQIELAAKSGISGGTVSRILSGTHVASPRTLDRIAKGLGVSRMVLYELASPLPDEDSVLIKEIERDLLALPLDIRELMLVQIRAVADAARRHESDDGNK